MWLNGSVGSDEALSLVGVWSDDATGRFVGAADFVGQSEGGAFDEGFGRLVDGIGGFTDAVEVGCGEGDGNGD